MADELEEITELEDMPESVAEEMALMGKGDPDNDTDEWEE